MSIQFGQFVRRRTAQGTRYLSIPDVKGIQNPNAPGPGATRAAYCQKVDAASSLGRREIRHSLFGSTVLVFEFRSAACLFSRFLKAETKSPQRRAEASINRRRGKRETIPVSNRPAFAGPYKLATDIRGIRESEKRLPIALFCQF
jgi:hypothetical protein